MFFINFRFKSRTRFKSFTRRSRDIPREKVSQDPVVVVVTVPSGEGRE
jgi:hypothetical protein